MIPWTLVAIRSSETPIILSTLSAAAAKVTKIIVRYIAKTSTNTNMHTDSCEYTHTQQSTKGDGGGQGGEVDEDDSSEDLGIESICDVALVVLIASLYVSNHPAKWSTCPGQGVVRWLPGGLRNWG